MEPDMVKMIAGRQFAGIAGKVTDGKRISPEEALKLFTEAPLSLLAVMATSVRSRINGDYAFFNRNFHIEPTNICVYNCRFCSYHRRRGDSDSWEYDMDQMLEMVRRFDGEPVTEVHIVGGVHPDHDLHYWGTLLRKIKEHRPSIHIKAFSAVELDYMINKSGLSIEEGLRSLKDYGLDSIPGGGAEIFDEAVRSSICHEKTSSARWIEIHKTAHNLGIPSNATMLYGHVENFSHRTDHMNRLRELQDRTGGFNSFIPLKYRSANNSMSHLGETTLTHDLRNYAVSRIFLDNIPHIKAYWPMLGREAAALSLSFGVDDIDGTIDDTTRIYSMAGSEENPSMSGQEMAELIKKAGFRPAERDTLYNIVREY
ncbi:MAG: aminofutalosine synthase MqnE [Bacteroidales bacterium]|jgi:aminodeoxyfutalosine synthase|nr:aminofutalosine synthase MqnE [Bacteroidales bacterium]